jgi:hypothetical protein
MSPPMSPPRGAIGALLHPDDRFNTVAGAVFFCLPFLFGLLRAATPQILKDLGISGVASLRTELARVKGMKIYHSADFKAVKDMADCFGLTLPVAKAAACESLCSMSAARVRETADACRLVGHDVPVFSADALARLKKHTAAKKHPRAVPAINSECTPPLPRARAPAHTALTHRPHTPHTPRPAPPAPRPARAPPRLIKTRPAPLRSAPPRLIKTPPRPAQPSPAPPSPA